MFFFVSPKCLVLTGVVVLLALLGGVAAVSAAEVTVTDSWGREVTIPEKVTRVICSGSGCLRYLVYLQGQDLAGRTTWKVTSMFESCPYYWLTPS